MIRPSPPELAGHRLGHSAQTTPESMRRREEAGGGWQRAEGGQRADGEPKGQPRIGGWWAESENEAVD
jgi:hypothetical protein